MSVRRPQQVILVEPNLQSAWKPNSGQRLRGTRIDHGPEGQTGGRRSVGDFGEAQPPELLANVTLSSEAELLGTKHGLPQDGTPKGPKLSYRHTLDSTRGPGSYGLWRISSLFISSHL